MWWYTSIKFHKLDTIGQVRRGASLLREIRFKLCGFAAGFMSHLKGLERRGTDGVGMRL